jgi:hypothetical protein
VDTGAGGGAITRFAAPPAPRRTSLTFSADVTYSRLDQKHSGGVAIPTIAALAKPAAVYELKDQDTVSMLFRAQRNW